MATVLWHLAEWPWTAASRSGPHYHDSANRLSDLPRRLERCTTQAQGGGLWHGCHTLGGYLACPPSDCVNGHFWGTRPGVRSRAGRNHGTCHARRQFEPVESFTLFTSQYPGCLAGLELPGGK